MPRHRGSVRTLFQGGQWSPALHKAQTVTRGSFLSPGRCGRVGQLWPRVPAPASIEHSAANLGEGVFLAITSGAATVCLGPRDTPVEHSNTLCPRPRSGALLSKGRLPRGTRSPLFGEAPDWAAGPLCPAPCLRTRAMWGSARRARTAPARPSGRKDRGPKARATEQAVLTAGLSLSP